MPRSGDGQDMGLGHLADADLVFKRKFRWAFEIQGLYRGDVPSHYVKLASRPTLQVEEAEINYLHGTDWIPGKGKWETISVTYYDVNAREMKPLWDWLASTYNFTDRYGLHQSSTRRSYAGTGVLRLFDGCGKTMETWNLYGLWPQAVNFGELDYSSSEEATIELTLRYSAAEVFQNCGFPIEPACGGCAGVSVGSYGYVIPGYVIPGYVIPGYTIPGGTIVTGGGNYSLINGGETGLPALRAPGPFTNNSINNIPII